jgi:hypothetical protein
MLGLRLVRLIEKHSEDLGDSLTAKLLASDRTLGYRTIREDELLAATISVYGHLEAWLLTKTDSDLERHFMEMGARRAKQGIASSQLAWALMMSKRQLWAYIYRESGVDKAFELYSELEFLEMLDSFYDRAVFFALVGYEQEKRAMKAA